MSLKFVSDWPHMNPSRLTRNSFPDKPIAGEIVVAVVGLKGVIGFGLSFGTNLWVDSQGYQNGELHLHT